MVNGIRIIIIHYDSLYPMRFPIFHWNALFRIDTLKNVFLSQLAIIHLLINRKNCLPA
ncbi:MAG: hypothetical protein UZ01_00251 [Candidatus Brocadia sinica]|nr:MAG: hypothetical protein UZ01_00251 [Candidatus Brocadia sinica]